MQLLPKPLCVSSSQILTSLRIFSVRAVCLFALAQPFHTSAAMGLQLEQSVSECGMVKSLQASPPLAAHQRIAGSTAVQGKQDIAWTWLGSPTVRYPHTALGSITHAGSLHVLLASGGAQLSLTLPLHRVFEDLSVRLIDLDKDGRDEVVVVESDALRGAALVVFGVHTGRLVELARSPFAGSTFRWLNPVGAADFDGDGRTDLAAVVTPHIGGRLTFYHYQPPRLTPYASASDVSNHRMGSPEQQLAVVLPQSQTGQRPAVIVPDMNLKALYVLRWAGSGERGSWQEIETPLPLPARAERLLPLIDAKNDVVGACALLADRTWWRVVFMH